MMNQKAQELGCTSTSFTCVHGLYDYGNVSSARDLALIASACAANETYMKVANTLSYTLPATNLHQNERSITSTNLMLNPEYPYYRDYIRGMKTGFTTLAGRCYVTLPSRTATPTVWSSSAPTWTTFIRKPPNCWTGPSPALQTGDWWTPPPR